MAKLTRKKPQPRPLAGSMAIELKVKPSGRSGFVMATIYHTGRRVRFSVGLSRIDINAWDKTHSKPRGDSLEAVGVRSAMDYVRSVTEQVFNDARQEVIRAVKENRLSSADPLLLLGQIQKTFSPTGGATDRPSGLVLSYGTFTNEYKPKGTSRELAVGTKKPYTTTGRLLSEWIANRSTGLVVGDFSMNSPVARVKAERLASEFYEWLTQQRTAKDGTPKTYNDGSAMKVCKTLNTFLGWCEAKGIGGYGKLYRFPLENVEYEATALEEADVTALEALDLIEGSRMWHVRNLFLLACYTGLRYSDWGRIRPELWKRAEQTVANQKGKETCVVVHRNEVRRILRLYESTGLPNVATNTKYSAKVNLCLKEVCRSAGLVRSVKVEDKRNGRMEVEYRPLCDVVTTHVGRATFITTELRKGVSRDIVKKQSGHKSDSSFRRYDGRTSKDVADVYSVTEYLEERI